MPDLKQVIKVTKEQMRTLTSGGDIDGHTLQDDVLYAVENDDANGLFEIPISQQSLEARQLTAEEVNYIKDDGHLNAIKKGAYLNLASGASLVVTAVSANAICAMSVANLLNISLPDGAITMTSLGGANPLIAENDTEMTSLLTDENVGKIVKYTGDSDGYEKDSLYLIEEK